MLLGSGAEQAAQSLDTPAVAAEVYMSELFGDDCEKMCDVDIVHSTLDWPIGDTFPFVPSLVNVEPPKAS